MTDPVPAPIADVYTVPYRSDHRGQEVALSASLRIGSAVLATVFALALSGYVWWLALDDDAGVGLVVTAGLVTVLMAVIVWLAWRPVRLASRRRRHLAQATDAMRISGDGVGFPDLDRGGWIVVPWSAINGARVMTWRTVRFLHLEIDPGLRPDQPGARGLDSPAALRELTRRSLGLVGPRFALAGLDRTAEQIDEALRRYSGGRVSVT